MANEDFNIYKYVFENGPWKHKKYEFWKLGYE